MSVDRRLHLSVGRELFLPVRLRVRTGASGEWLFGEPQLHELLSLLRLTVPPRLASLLAQRVRAREAANARPSLGHEARSEARGASNEHPTQVPTRDAHIAQGDTLTASLTYQPTSSALWLVGTSEQGCARGAVPFTLICEVAPLTQEQPAPPRARTLS